MAQQGCCFVPAVLLRSRLKHVQVEVMTPVVSARARVVVLPPFVVDRYSHLLRISVVQTFGASVVMVPPEILWVIHIWIVVESFPIIVAVLAAPYASEGTLVSRR